MTQNHTYRLNEPLLTFPHGIHPEEYKELTCDQPIRRMPFVAEYTLLLSQHIGAPARPVVQEGQRVQRGELIAESEGWVSVALHAPVDGWVSAIDLADHPSGKMMPAIRIKTDPLSDQRLRLPALPDPRSITTKDFLAEVQRAGIVGLGGAAFPSHVKFSVPEGKKCRYLMVNGCECEPFLTCDHRMMVEYADAVIDGLDILQHHIRAEKLAIAIEANKPDAVHTLREAAAKRGVEVEVIPLQVKYPQGAEKMMITAILGEEVPSGKIPIDVGVLVSNVGTVAAIAHLFRRAEPLIERVVTVTGPGINRPGNVLVPIGTPMQELLEFCGGLKESANRILLGGPMMGMVQKNMNIPVLKGTSGILALSEQEVRDFDTYNCIRCGRCLDACPLFLNPARMGLLVRKGMWDDLEKMHVMDCFECGSCSYICPSGIPLVQSFRVGKSFLRDRKRKQKSI